VNVPSLLFQRAAMFVMGLGSFSGVPVHLVPTDLSVPSRMSYSATNR